MSFSNSADSTFAKICSFPTKITHSPLLNEFISTFSFSDIFKCFSNTLKFSSSKLKNIFISELFNMLFPYAPSSRLNKSDTSCVIATALPPYFLIVLKILYIKLATSLFDVTPISCHISSKYILFCLFLFFLILSQNNSVNKNSPYFIFSSPQFIYISNYYFIV